MRRDEAWEKGTRGFQERVGTSVSRSPRFPSVGPDAVRKTADHTNLYFFPIKDTGSAAQASTDSCFSYFGEKKMHNKNGSQ